MTIVRIDAGTVSASVAALTAYRRATGLSQQQVADAMGTTQSAVSDLENGVTNPRLLTFVRYATAVGVAVQVVFDDGR